MANIFAITTADEDITADADGKVKIAFTVTNTSNKPLRGVARARALGNTLQEWLDVDGEAERDFSAHGTQQFTVKFSKPKTSSAAGQTASATEKFPFRMDVASSLNPDEQFTEGPRVNVEVASAAGPPPVVKKKFPHWVFFLIGGAVLMLLGLGLGSTFTVFIAVVAFLVAIVRLIIYFIFGRSKPKPKT